MGQWKRIDGHRIEQHKYSQFILKKEEKQLKYKLSLQESDQKKVDITIQKLGIYHLYTANIILVIREPSVKYRDQDDNIRKKIKNPI